MAGGAEDTQQDFVVRRGPDVLAGQGKLSVFEVVSRRRAGVKRAEDHWNPQGTFA
jgi:hypothetical protein